VEEREGIEREDKVEGNGRERKGKEKGGRWKFEPPPII